MTETLSETGLQILRAELEGRKLDLYRPYPKQQLFHKRGKTYREQLLRAGSQQGKTYAAAAEVAMHATGRYAPWWEGRVFKKAPVIWCAGVTGETVRDTIQKLLIGSTANPGTGLIPKADIVELLPSRGVADLVDTILVKHISGGTTRLRLKYYEQGREKFQADTCDLIWLDEECDIGIYSEALTRTNATGGMLFMTFTPLKGMSEVVRRFLKNSSADRIDTNMTIDDALHIKPEERQKIIDSYEPHEREARIKGIPSMGRGRVFPIAEEIIYYDAILNDKLPMHWQTLGGIDLGGTGPDSHPTAAVKLLYDPDNDVIYVANAYSRKGATPTIHAAALRAWGNLSFAWPHDGLKHDSKSGEQIAQIYRDEGLKLLSERATFPDGTNGVEAGITQMLMRMETGRLKVAKHLSEWFDEFRLYYRGEDNKIAKENDDLMDATRYAIMMLRYAEFIFKQSPNNSGYGQNLAVYDPLSKRHVQAEIGGQGAPAAGHTSSYDPFNREYVRKNL